jgi:hypothetical protein
MRGEKLTTRKVEELIVGVEELSSQGGEKSELRQAKKSYMR